MINEDAPTMSAGTGGFSGSANASGPVAGFDPMLGSNNEKKPKLRKRKYGTKKDVKEAKVDKKLPDHKRATARDKRYGNPHGSHELGGGIRKDRRADHEARRGVKEEPEVYWSSEALDQLDQINERLGGKGYSKKATKGGGDWEDSDRGAGNKATRRAGGKVKVKSPTYIAHVKNKNVKEGLVVGHVTPKSEKENDRYLPFKVCYDGAQEYVLYGKSEADIKIQLRKIYRPENHKKIYVKRLYPNQVIKFYYDLRMKALKNQ